MEECRQDLLVYTMHDVGYGWQGEVQYLGLGAVQYPYTYPYPYYYLTGGNYLQLDNLSMTPEMADLEAGFFPEPAIQKELRNLADAVEKKWVPRCIGVVSEYVRNHGFVAVRFDEFEVGFLR